MLNFVGTQLNPYCLRSLSLSCPWLAGSLYDLLCIGTEGVKMSCLTEAEKEGRGFNI